MESAVERKAMQLFYVASVLRNNLKHENFTQNIYFAISQLQVNESWWKLHEGCVTSMVYFDQSSLPTGIETSNKCLFYVKCT